MEVEAPLDLSVTASRLKVEYCTDDSDDSDGHGPNADPNCKAYKKSLMKRYCEFMLSIVTNIYFTVTNTLPVYRYVDKGIAEIKCSAN